NAKPMTIQPVRSQTSPMGARVGSASVVGEGEAVRPSGGSVFGAVPTRAGVPAEASVFGAGTCASGVTASDAARHPVPLGGSCHAPDLAERLGIHPDRIPHRRCVRGQTLPLAPRKAYGRC